MLPSFLGNSYQQYKCTYGTKRGFGQVKISIWFQVNGKQKAYVVNQETLEIPEGENIDEMDAIIRTKTAELNELKEEQKAVEGSLRSWTSKLRDRYEFSILVLFTFKLVHITRGQ